MIFNLFKRKDSEPIAALIEQLELTTKAARRCAHDLQHCASDVWHCLDRNKQCEFWHERAQFWQSVFYPDRGPKNYRAKLHTEIDDLYCQLERLRKLLAEHGIDDPTQDIPF